MTVVLTVLGVASFMVRVFWLDDWLDKGFRLKLSLAFFDISPTSLSSSLSSEKLPTRFIELFFFSSDLSLCDDDISPKVMDKHCQKLKDVIFFIKEPIICKHANT